MDHSLFIKVFYTCISHLCINVMKKKIVYSCLSVKLMDLPAQDPEVWSSLVWLFTSAISAHLWPLETCCCFSSHALTPGLILSAFLWVRVWVNMTAWFSHHQCQGLLALLQSSMADWTCLSMSCWFPESEHDCRRYNCQRCHNHCHGHFRWHKLPPTFQMFHRCRWIQLMFFFSWNII